jgi:hypothetical protein
MSIVACVKVYDGIVIGAESMSQLFGQTPAPAGQQLGQSQFVKAFSNARKVFQIRKLRFGVLAYGAGNIGNRSVESFLDEFNERSDLENENAEVIATKLLEFMRGPYNAAFGQAPQQQRPMMGLYLAGFSPKHHLGSEWEFQFPIDAKPRIARPDDQLGASWRGIVLPFARLHSGMDARILDSLRSQGIDPSILRTIQDTANSFISPWVFDGMPLKDAIGFCKFILETTINTSAYESGVPTCGGPLHIAIITRQHFKWIMPPDLVP